MSRLGACGWPCWVLAAILAAHSLAALAAADLEVCSSFGGGAPSDLGPWVIRQFETQPNPEGAGLWLAPANAQDYYIPNPDPSGFPCPASVNTTTLQAGPFVGTNGIFDYATTYYSVEYGRYQNMQGGRCITRSGWNLDAQGHGVGAGVLCGKRSNGPKVSVVPISVAVNKRRFVNVRLTRNGQGVAGQRLALQLSPVTPASGQIWGECERTDAEGYVMCNYQAPAKPTVDNLKATWRYEDIERETAEGAITVTPPSIVLGFFNGVWNTSKQAGEGLDALKEVVGPAHGDIQIHYEKFYNQTGRTTGNTEAQDIAETFIQRGTELEGVLAERWEHYWEMLSGRHRTEGSLTDRLLGGLRAGGSALSGLIDAIVSRMLAGLVKGLAQLVSNPPTAVDMAAHINRLQAMADEGNDFVLVAHSQGNLFVNLAHDSLRDTRPDAKRSVVHVAPASPTLRGEHVLANVDQVINGLRNFGNWTVLPINFWMPYALEADASGHTLVGTYLDGDRKGSPNPKGDPPVTARDHVKGMIVKALDKVSAP